MLTWGGSMNDVFLVMGFGRDKKKGGCGDRQPHSQGRYPGLGARPWERGLVTV